METLASYLPAFQVRRVIARGGPPAEPFAETCQAAFLFVDVAGFTQLTEQLGQRGPAGAEQLSDALNLYFGRLTDLVTAHGGDILLFAGDAALALWPCAPEALGATAAVAAGCALAVCHELSGFSPSPDIVLHQRAAIGAGPVAMMEVGGSEGEWHFLVAGDAIRQAAAADAEARAGDVVLSPETWAVVQSVCSGEVLFGGHVRLVSAPKTPPQPSAALAVGAELETALAPYLPRAVRARIQSGHGAWIAEFRQVSVLFVTLHGLDFQASETLDRVQRAMEAMQATVRRFEGSVYQCLMDDKGTTMVGAFGLPPLALEDGPARALEAGLELHGALLAQGLRPSVGITTGRAFCGAYGSAARRQYTIVGPVINLAARLMQAAEGGVLCDDATAQAAAARIRCEVLPAIAVKGRTDRVVVHRPVERTERRVDAGASVIGRVAEREALGRRLDALRGGRGGLVWIEGESGIGKSYLLADLAARARTDGTRVLSGAGDAVDRATAYFPWRGVLTQLLGAAGASPDLLRLELTRRLEGDVTRLARAPLLNAILPFDLPETAVSRSIEGEARQDGVSDLVASLLDQVAGEHPTLLLLDDLHWFDSTSLQLLTAIARLRPRVLVVAGTRPPEEPVAAPIRELRDLAEERLALAPLAVDDLPALLARQLGTAAVPEELVQFILQRAEGHPFYSEETALALREAGLIEIRNGTCRIVAGPGRLTAVNFPDTVQAVISSRIDRLPAYEQLLVKTASVIGRVFAYRTLHDVYPVLEDRPRLRDGLEHVERLDLTRLETPEPELAYLFKHVITQEVAYGSLLFVQRRQLHRAVAEWLESRQPEARESQAPVLAHHWDHAGDPERAVEYLERAGAQAVRSFANREAVGFLTRALEVAPDLELTDHSRVAHWEYLLGEALIHLSEYNAAGSHLRRTLVLSHYPAPTNRRATMRRLAAQVLIQATHRVWPTRMAGRVGSPARQDLTRAAAAQKRLAEVAWFNDDLLQMLCGILTSLNLAERAGATREMADGYCSMGVVAGLTGLHALARSYLRRSEAAVPIEQATTDLARTSIVFGMSVGDWDRVRRDGTRGCDAFHRLGDRFLWESCRGGLGFMHLLTGQFAESRRCFEEALESARYGALQSRLWGYAGLCALQLAVDGGVEESLLVAYTAELERNVHQTEALVGRGLLGLAALRAGQPGAALAHATQALELARRSLPSVYYALWGLAGACEVLLQAASSHATTDLATAHRRQARQACVAFRRFAFIIATAKPRAALMAGREAWLTGGHRRAGRHWRRGLRHAQRLRMPYDEGLLHLEIALHLSGPDPSRARHLGRAESLFTEVGARHDLHRAQEAQR